MFLIQHISLQHVPHIELQKSITTIFARDIDTILLFSELHYPDQIDLIELHKEKWQGIGLNLCKQIMQIHKGTISVQSVENEGTAFYLRFQD